MESVRQRERLVTVGGLPDNLQVRFLGEQPDESATKHGVVIGDEDADHGRPAMPAVGRTATTLVP